MKAFGTRDHVGVTLGEEHGEERKTDEGEIHVCDTVVTHTLQPNDPRSTGRNYFGARNRDKIVLERIAGKK